MPESSNTQDSAGDVDVNPGRRFLRPRFGLKSLLVVVTLTGSFFGFFYPYVRRQQVENEAVVQLKSTLAATGNEESEFFYNYQEEDENGAPKVVSGRRGPKWIRHLFGDNIFSTINRVQLDSGWEAPETTFEDISKDLAKLENIEKLSIDNWRKATDADFFARYPG